MLTQNQGAPSSTGAVAVLSLTIVHTRGKIVCTHKTTLPWLVSCFCVVQTLPGTDQREKPADNRMSSWAGSFFWEPNQTAAHESLWALHNAACADPCSTARHAIWCQCREIILLRCLLSDWIAALNYLHKRNYANCNTIFHDIHSFHSICISCSGNH